MHTLGYKIKSLTLLIFWNQIHKTKSCKTQRQRHLVTPSAVSTAVTSDSVLTTCLSQNVPMSTSDSTLTTVMVNTYNKSLTLWLSSSRRLLEDHVSFGVHSLSGPVY